MYRLSAVFFAVALYVLAVGPEQGIIPAAASGQPALLEQRPYKTEDGPYVLWEGGTAAVHWVKGGKHAEESFKAPFELSIPGFESKLRLDGKPYLNNADNELPMPSKIFALSDVHGIFEYMRDILIAHEVIDEHNNWAFGDGHLVILGDVAGRGDKVTEIYWFIRVLEESAQKAGGRVHMIIGNHENMLLAGDYRYVHPSCLNQPEGLPGLGQLFGTQSEIGRWLHSRPILVKLGSMLFVHGGISPEFVARGLDIATVNREKRIVPRAERNDFDNFLLGSSGPLWYRGLVADDLQDSISSIELDKVLAHFGAKQIVVGHTIVENASLLHGGRVLAIDTAIQRRQGGGVFIENGKTFRALKDGSKVEIR